MNEGEPTTDDAASAWIETSLKSVDPFLAVREASAAHRVEHGCDAYATTDAALLGVAAAAIGARRVLEIGGALGYSALWLAHGSAPVGVVETIEADPTHVELIRRNAAAYGVDKRLVVYEGYDRDVLPGLAGPYDLVFYDAYIPGPELIDHCSRLLRPGGLLIASNVFLGRYVPDSPDLARGAAFRDGLLHSGDWLVSFANLKALAVHR